MIQSFTKMNWSSHCYSIPSEPKELEQPEDELFSESHPRLSCSVCFYYSSRQSKMKSENRQRALFSLFIWLWLARLIAYRPPSINCQLRYSLTVVIDTQPKRVMCAMDCLFQMNKSHEARCAVTIDCDTICEQKIVYRKIVYSGLRTVTLHGKSFLLWHFSNAHRA